MAPRPAASAPTTKTTSDEAQPLAVAPPAPPLTAADRPPPPPPAPDDGRKLLRAPESYEHLIIKVGLPFTSQFSNLRYEGFNGLFMNGASGGAEVAERWRSLCLGVRAVFVLRDSLWSQQDHPYHRPPFALMMPPSWVTVAVAAVASGESIRPLRTAALDNDADWAAIATPEAMFGAFPPSDSLHREATRPLAGASDVDRLHTESARRSLRSLAEDVAAMIAAAPRGIEAVASAGAERIAQSDDRYFGTSIRYHRVVPIFVENPNTRELVDEGKGMTVKGRHIDQALVRLARDTVYLRRLRDGDMAVERYDLSVAAERARAIEVLTALIPAEGAQPGGTLWLWVTGKLDPHREGEGENAVRYLPAFLAELEAAPIDRDRLRVVSKPATELPRGSERPRVLRSDVSWYRHRHLPYAVRLSTGELQQLLAAP